MLKIEKEKQESFFGDFIYEQVIPKNHFLVKMAQVIDFSFVNDLVKDLYHETNGRPAWEPQVLFKMLFLEFLHKLSDVEISKMAQTELAFKWFIGLKITDAVPDDSTLVRFRQRLGENKLKKIFEEVLSVANQKGLFLKKRMVIIDSTDIKANVDIGRLAKYYKNEETAKTYVTDNSPDQEARFGRKNKNKIFYGYKSHLNYDVKSELITEVQVTDGAPHDRTKFKDNIAGDSSIEKGSGAEILGDKAYSGKAERDFLKKNGLKPRMIPHRKNDRDYLKKVAQCQWLVRARKTRPFIEKKISELKTWHGLKKARYWGKAKVYGQAIMTAIVVNLKRMVKLLFEPPPWLRAVGIKRLKVENG